MNHYIPLVMFCISASITPGPNNLMLLMSGVNFGIWRSIPHYLGIVIGFVFMLLLIGYGIEAIFKILPMLHQTIKILGSIYMLYMAYKIIFASTKIQVNGAKRPISFVAAALFQWANPKAWVMAVGVFATFGSASNLGSSVWLISIIYGVILLPCIFVWLVGGILLKVILNNEKHIRIFNLITGLLLAASIITILI